MADNTTTQNTQQTVVPFQISQNQIPAGEIKERHLLAVPTIANGDMVYGDGNNNWQQISIGATNNVLTVSSGGVPVWSQIPTQKVTELYDTNSNGVILTSAATTPVNQITTGNAATGHNPTIMATGTDSNISLDLSGKGNGFVKIEVLEQDIAANVYRPHTVILTGWSFITGDGSSVNFTKAITFGITFTAAPVVVTSWLGSLAGSDPVGIGDFSSTLTNTVWPTGGISITTGGFTASLPFTSAPGNTVRVGFSWTAIGTL